MSGPRRCRTIARLSVGAYASVTLRLCLPSLHCLALSEME